jgi:formylglycine-generating enzyme required for sulfatase activity
MFCAVALTSLSGCYNPDYGSKPCSANDGCPTGYFCDTKRASTAAPGTCSLGSAPIGSVDMALADMGPHVPNEYVVNGPASFFLGTSGNYGVTSNDYPGYTRTIGSFCAEETEVTVADYTRCVQAKVCTPPAGGMNAGCNYGVTGKEQHPVNCVDLPQAQAFCQWINRRLPTEYEWEFAANGPTTNQAEKYPWAGAGGSFVATDACFNQGGTCAVGTASARTYRGQTTIQGTAGFYDLAGNVWEWTTTEFCPYNGMSDATCSSMGRVVRGGSGFDTNSELLRSTVRLGNAMDENSTGVAFPNAWFKNLGFRCFGDVNLQGGCGP